MVSKKDGVCCSKRSSSDENICTTKEKDQGCQSYDLSDNWASLHTSND